MIRSIHALGLAVVSLFLPILAAAPARAQTSIGLQPQLTNKTIDSRYENLNIEEFEDNTEVRLGWNVNLLDAAEYSFEITYDQASTEETTATLIEIEESASNRNRGAVERASPTNNTVPMEVLIRTQKIIPADRGPGSAGAQNQGSRAIVVRVFLTDRPFEISSTLSFTINYDTLPPPPPTRVTTSPGDRLLSVSWTAPNDSTDVARYELLLWRDPPLKSDTASCSTANLDLVALAEIAPREEGSVAESALRGAISSGLENGQCAAVSVRSRDVAENPGDFASPVAGVPIPVDDFYEYYRNNGGAEEGGFCFIATAAYGSYAHPLVRVLRLFRDVALETGPIGRQLVAGYYRFSPPIAERVRSSPALAAVVRLYLVPVALASGLLLLAPLIAAALLLRRRRAPLLLLAALLFGRPAFAEPIGYDDRVGVGYALEARGGPYRPELHTDPSFSNIFGTAANPLFGLGFDFQIFRNFGTLGLGVNWGFMQFVGKGRIPGSDNRPAPDTTVFNLMPMTGTVFYRFDYLAYTWGIPVVPYLRGGLAYHVWWVTDGRGDLARDPKNPDSRGLGGKFGYTGTAGVAVLLNGLDPSGARSLFESTGIRGTSVFVEYQIQEVDGFGAEGFNLSDATWSAGLYLEF